MKTVNFQLYDLTCPSCINKIKAAISNQKGVSDTKVMFSSSRVIVSYDENFIRPEKIKKTILNLGYGIQGDN